MHRPASCEGLEGGGGRLVRCAKASRTAGRDQPLAHAPISPHACVGRRTARAGALCASWARHGARERGGRRARAAPCTTALRARPPAPARSAQRRCGRGGARAGRSASGRGVHGAVRRRRATPATRALPPPPPHTRPRRAPRERGRGARRCTRAGAPLQAARTQSPASCVGHAPLPPLWGTAPQSPAPARSRLRGPRPGAVGRLPRRHRGPPHPARPPPPELLCAPPWPRPVLLPRCAGSSPRRRADARLPSRLTAPTARRGSRERGEEYSRTRRAISTRPPLPRPHAEARVQALAGAAPTSSLSRFPACAACPGEGARRPDAAPPSLST